MKKEIPKHKLVERRGIYYEVDSIVPFTGSTIEYCIVKKTELKKREGISETFFQNGQLESRGTYKKGERHGLYEYYYKNGQVWEKSNFKNGKKDGLSQNFDEDGNLTKADYHKDGNLLINN